MRIDDEQEERIIEASERWKGKSKGNKGKITKQEQIMIK